MRELRTGFWHWQAPDPDWTPNERWPRVVSSSAIDDGSTLVLVDPLAVPSEILELAADRNTVIVLTAPWHERGARRLVERLDARVFVPAPDTADDLVRKYGPRPSGRLVAARTSRGCSPARATATCTPQATGFRAGWRPCSEGKPTTWCSGSSGWAP